MLRNEFLHHAICVKFQPGHQEESHHAQAPLTLGAMVVTNDEASHSGSTVCENEAKLSTPQQAQKLRNRGHHRTASTRSNINVNILPPNSSVKEKDNVLAQMVLIYTMENRRYLNIQADQEVLHLARHYTNLED